MEFLEKFSAFIQQIIDTIKNLVASIRSTNDEKEKEDLGL